MPLVASTFRRRLALVKCSCWPLSADRGYKACWSNPMKSVFRTNANDWAGQLQVEGQVGSNFAICVHTPACATKLFLIIH